MESEGSAETARVRQDKRTLKGSVERKIVLLVWELQRYNIYAAAISETKWFNSNVYEVEGHVVLHSGRELPEDGEQFLRSEGVGIILSPEAAKAWRDGDEQWKAVSSRIITARLRIGREGRHHQYMFLVSVYAPTFRAPQKVKDDFFADVQMVLDSVPEKDILVILGDWNVRVGSQKENHLWEGVLGKHGLGNVNEAGLFLLSFCGTNGLTIMNTFFEKKDIYKQSWQHPGTKVWHCIDYVIMRQSQRRRCVDVQVMRGAECWSDHKMVRARLSLLSRRPRRQSSTNTRAKDAKHFKADELKNDNVSLAFNSKLSELLDQRWSNNLTAQDKLATLVDSTKEVAQQHLLADNNKRDADWFKENEHIIRPALEKRNNLLRTWLSSKAEGIE